MMHQIAQGKDVLFVGSIPGENAEEVFERCAGAIGERALAFPDGEFGPRQMWVGALGDLVFSRHPGLERAPDTYLPFGTYRVKQRTEPISFGDLYPYTRHALESYQVFDRLRRAGRLPSDAKFQVSLPTSYAAISSHFTDLPANRPLIDAWSEAMRSGYEQMLQEIPGRDLVIQLDYCIEFVDIHGDTIEDASLAPHASRDRKIEVYTAPAFLGDMTRNIPSDVMLGYHICAGTFPKWPLSNLSDLGLAVDVANRLIANTPRRVDFLHLPVMATAGAEYFAPLKDLTPGPKVFLGLECCDGKEQMERRIAAAKQHSHDFGIAHFCGYGREYAQQIDSLLSDLRAGSMIL